MFSFELVCWINTKSQSVFFVNSKNLDIFENYLQLLQLNAPPLLQMPWTHVIFYDLELIRANRDLVLAEKSDSGKLFAAIARSLLLSIHHYSPCSCCF